MSLVDLIFGRSKAVMTSKLLPVTIVDDLVISVPICSNLVGLVRVTRVEIHYEQEFTFLKHNHFVFFIR